jgi:hypothetical protein
MICKICSGRLREFAVARVLSKYDVRYDRCDACGFILTENPYWLKEAYDHPINETDTGLLSRNIYLSRVASNIIRLFRFSPIAKFLDYGGGYGVFVRLMRDAGKDFYWKDPYCQNLFAKGFEHQEGVGGSYELLTSFEVLEHSMDPVKDMEKMLSFAPNVLLTTECVPVSCPRPGEWWYYGLAHGQHIALFSKRSLEVLADRMGMRFYSRSSIHLLTKKKISNVSFHLACMISRYIS